MATVRRFLRYLFTAAIAVVLLFEEWGWEPLAAGLARLARLPLWARIERRIAALPPWGALLVYFVPMLALLPVKVLALYLFAHDHPAAGLGLLIAAKLAGTALLARLFILTQPALMQLAWFARWYPRWKTWKDRVMDEVRGSALWRTVRHVKRRAKARWQAVRRAWSAQPRDPL